jgi:hypothetical protein
MREIKVRPSCGVWVVETGARACLFTRASEAERWAREEAQTQADAGDPVILSVFDLQDQPIGQLVIQARRAFA